MHSSLNADVFRPHRRGNNRLDNDDDTSCFAARPVGLDAFGRQAEGNPRVSRHYTDKPKGSFDVIADAPTGQTSPRQKGVNGTPR